jgi:uncharacterized protein YdbL (DUF1318 family)
MRQRAALDRERILAAAGFQMKLADTPERQEHLQAFVPQRQLTPHTIDGQLRFVYADAAYCKCVYVGTEAANQRYQKLAIQKEISDQQVEAANANEAASMNWGAWGGWGPWY